ncbi:MAG: choline-sulfatase [Terriglobia bacterium]
MNRREFMKTPVEGALVSGLAKNQTARSAQRASDPQPNIILIMADQVTPFMLAPYGQTVARTPALSFLARTGTVFDAAYCASPLCVPSRMCLATGRLAHKIQAYDNASELPTHLPSFVGYLRGAGYRTIASGKCHFIGPDQLHGFDERLTPDIFPADFSMLPDWRLGPVFNQGTSIGEMLRMLGPSKWTPQLGFDQMTFDRAIARLREYAIGNHEGQPFFLKVSFTEPHDPFTTTRHFLDLYKNADIPLPKDYGSILKLSPTYEWFIIHHGINRVKLSPARIREARRNYLGMISWVDDRIGKLLAEMQRLGIDKNTVIIFTSDHGEMLGEHGQWSKRLMLEWSIRVPLIVSAPGLLPEGRRVAAPVSLIDLFPTLAELAGAKVETAVDGRSLLGLLKGEESGGERAVVAEYLGEGTIEPVRMIRRENYKYITVNGYPPQLFDLSADPHETVNAAGRAEYAQAERRLRELAEKDWDGPALKRAVIENQEERRVVWRSTHQHGQPPHWDFQPVEKGVYDPRSDFTVRCCDSP